jgi:hypothetical protein
VKSASVRKRIARPRERMLGRGMYICVRAGQMSQIKKKESKSEDGESVRVRKEECQRDEGCVRMRKCCQSEERTCQGS